MKGHTRGVVTIEYSPSQRIIVSAGFDHDILVWSPVAGQVMIYMGNGPLFRCCSFSECTCSSARREGARVYSLFVGAKTIGYGVKSEAP